MLPQQFTLNLSQIIKHITFMYIYTHKKNLSTVRFYFFYRRLIEFFLFKKRLPRFN